MTDINRPLLGEPNAPCRSCGSPLAADQRYCLQCGARRAEARLPFLEILARQVPAVASETTTVRRTEAGGTWLSRLSTNTAAVAGVACLLLALGVGVLIGGLGGDDDAGARNAAAPQIITVGGSAVAPVAATSAAPVSTTAPAGTDATTDDASSGADDKASKKSAASAKSDKKAAAEVKDLEKASGDDYAKKSEKLPKTLGTGGAPPPVDKSKPIGGGSETEEIG